MSSDRQQPKTKRLFAIVAVVVVVVVAAGFLYFLTAGSDAPTVRLIPSVMIHGECFLIDISKPTPWDAFTIQLRDQSGATASWAPLTSKLDNGTTSNYTEGPETLGYLSVSCNITDLSGNGRVDLMDFFTLVPGVGEAFSSSQTYTVTLIYEPTTTEVCRVTFIG